MLGRKLIQRLARRYGIRLGRCARTDGVALSYDGKVLDIRSRYDGFMGSRPDSDAMHDIAHHLCADPDRYHLPEWGLGPGIDTRSRNCPCIVVDPDLEEGMASFLGILMERAAGWPWRETWSEHSWGGDGLSHLVSARRDLGKWLAMRDRSLDEILEDVRKLNR